MARDTSSRAAASVPRRVRRRLRRRPRAQHPIGSAQHQFRRSPIDGRRCRRGESDPHFASADLHRRTSGENRRADHPVAAADNGKRAERALVHVAPRPGQRVRHRRGKRRPVEAMAACRRDGSAVDVEAVHGHVAGVIDAFAGEEPRLQDDEGGRCRGTDRRTDGRTGVGVDAAWDVQSEDRHAGTVRALDHRCVLRRQRALEADAEQPVDDERAAPAVREIGNRRPAGVQEFAMAAAASAGSADASAQNTTATSKNHCRSQRATTKASPPLLPGPASTSTAPLRVPAVARATSAAALPARSISGAGRAVASIAAQFGAAIDRSQDWRVHDGTIIGWRPGPFVHGDAHGQAVARAGTLAAVPRTAGIPSGRPGAGPDPNAAVSHSTGGIP